jgi:hypothetical protein
MADGEIAAALERILDRRPRSGRTPALKTTQPPTYVTASMQRQRERMRPGVSCTTCDKNSSAGGMLMTSGGTSSQSR